MRVITVFNKYIAPALLVMIVAGFLTSCHTWHHRHHGHHGHGHHGHHGHLHGHKQAR